MDMRITFTSQKGGVGKTSLAASLAVAAQQAGETVIVLDLDPQGSLAAWGDERKDDGLAVDRLGPEQIAQLPSILAAKGFTLAILDTPGIANTAEPFNAGGGYMPDPCQALADWPTVVDGQGRGGNTGPLGMGNQRTMGVFNVA
jgi:hypothetical protein